MDGQVNAQVPMRSYLRTAQRISKHPIITARGTSNKSRHFFDRGSHPNCINIFILLCLRETQHLTHENGFI
jgi:hypothetical protein